MALPNVAPAVYSTPPEGKAFGATPPDVLSTKTPSAPMPLVQFKLIVLQVTLLNIKLDGGYALTAPKVVAVVLATLLVL